MLDEMIVDLYWERSENAIDETSKKYGKYCHSIAYNILRNTEDSEECVNDTYFSAWNSMPNQRPNQLSAFLGKITRNIALNKYEYYSAQKRGNCQISIALEELGDCVSNSENTENVIDQILIGNILNHFLGDLDRESRSIFVSRYWFLYSIKEIAAKYHITESKVKSSLYRSRHSLKKVLEEEGVY